MLRRLILIISLPLLILGLCLLRSYRFERVADEPTVGMAALKSALPHLPEGAAWVEGPHEPTLRIASHNAKAHVRIVYRLPVKEPIEALHVRTTVSTRRLVPGKEEWQAGRISLKWEREGTPGWMEYDPLVNARGEKEKRDSSLVSRPAVGKSYPVIVIENLATSGEFLVDGLECTPVSHRAGWFWARWALAACWFAWVFTVISGSPPPSIIRRCATASLWVVMGILLAYPGPWNRLPPLLLPYELGTELPRQAPSPIPTPPHFAKPAQEEVKKPKEPVAQQAAVHAPEKESWIIRFRNHFKEQRILLHIGFVVAITVLFSCLVGGRRAAWLAGGLVVAMEVAQVGFGYHFDSMDFWDLVCGAAGITIGWLVFGRLNRWSAISRWMALPSAELAAPSVTDGVPDQRKA